MEQDKKYYCHYCNFETNKPYSWIRHCESAKHLRHGAKKIHKCAECDFESIGTWNLKIHVLSQHSSKEERAEYKYYCDACDVIFISKLYYDKHMHGKKHENRVKANELLDKLKKEKKSE
jgi:hypothetical protein